MDNEQLDFIKNAAVGFVELEEVFVPFYCTQEQFSKAVVCFYDSIKQDMTIERIKNL